MNVEGNERRLVRELGVGGAVLMGLGSIIGTGVFVSIGIAAGVSGPAVVLATALAAVVAACNGLSSAQLAAAHPVSGGTYEYGYRVLGPRLGFTAGWMFLCAKSASAATAALGFAGYLLSAFGLHQGLRVTVALAVTAAITLLVLGGMRRTNRINATIVSIALASLGFFIVAGLPSAAGGAAMHLDGFFGGGDGPFLPGLLEATALMFVAYTGYGRIATLGEEVREPARTIPRAIVITLVTTMFLYVAVAFVAIAAVGADAFAEFTEGEAAPLELVARTYPVPTAGDILAAGAVAAMLGVLLNLVLGLSRVWLAMGRRKDMPSILGRVDRRGITPWPAVILTGATICGLASIGSVKTTWSFSAFTVLVYYALTNLSALRLSVEQRMFPRWVSWGGLIGCLFLAFWVQPAVWLSGLGLIAAGLVWQQVAGGIRKSSG